MDNQINEILDDLYRFDPTLKSKQEELINVIDKLISIKPKTGFSQDFSDKLRIRLISEISANKVRLSRFKFFNRYFISGVVSSICVFVLGQFIYFELINPTNIDLQGGKFIQYLAITGNDLDNTGFDSSVTGQSIVVSGISEHDSNSYSELSVVAPLMTGTDKGTDVAKPLKPSFPVKPKIVPKSSSKPIDKSSGLSVSNVIGGISQNIQKVSDGSFGKLAINSNGSIQADKAMPSVDNSMKASGAVSMMGLMGGSLSDESSSHGIKYQFNGDMIKIPNKLPVYKVVKSSDDGIKGNSFLSIGGKTIDLSRLYSPRLTNITINEGKTDGYSVNIDFLEKIVSISKNSNFIGVENQTALRLNDVPSNQKLITISDKFLDQFSIDKSLFGKPLVNESWKGNGELSPDIYVPDVFTLTYPLTIGGYDIYETYGEPVGISLNIDIRKGDVQSLYGLSFKSLQSSEYEMKSDLSNLFASGDTNVIKLSNPKIVYERQYIQSGNDSFEYYIPAISFEVVSDNNFAPKIVLFSLLKE